MYSIAYVGSYLLLFMLELHSILLIPRVDIVINIHTYMRTKLQVNARSHFKNDLVITYVVYCFTVAVLVRKS